MLSLRNISYSGSITINRIIGRNMFCYVYNNNIWRKNVISRYLLIFFVLIGSVFAFSDVLPEGNLENKENEEIPLVDVKSITNPPIIVGEKLTYKVKIGWVSVGQRVDYVTKKTFIKNKPIYHISSIAKTGALVSFYRFKSLQYTYLNLEQLQPIRFRNQLQDKKYSAIVEISFNDGEAEYNKKSQANAKAPQKQDKKVLKISTGTQDELSMIYFLRSKQLAPGNTYYFPLISKGKVVKVVLNVKRGERMKVKGIGQVNTLLVQTSEGSRLWLTDDSHHLPIRIETDTKIGKTVAELAKREIIR
ncbi:hypothetical protein C6497_01220 [Candidatus Poribacteria bacterium]|nr:MAG: hypothetical protein C6497_01220 [Candidatus Poribacteria bacterium]